MPYKDPEKKREYDRQRSRSPKELARNREYKRARRLDPAKKKLDQQIYERCVYGITRDDMLELLGSDDCTICGFNGGKKRNSIDHCHEVNEVRGFLCASCNLGLGLFNHQTDRLQKALQYLTAPPLIAPEKYQRMLRVARQDIVPTEVDSDPHLLEFSTDLPIQSAP